MWFAACQSAAVVQTEIFQFDGWPWNLWSSEDESHARWWSSYVFPPEPPADWHKWFWVKTSWQLLDGLPWNRRQIFMSPSGFIFYDFGDSWLSCCATKRSTYQHVLHSVRVSIHRIERLQFRKLISHSVISLTFHKGFLCERDLSLDPTQTTRRWIWA